MKSRTFDFGRSVEVRGRLMQAYAECQLWGKFCYGARTDITRVHGIYKTPRRGAAKIGFALSSVKVGLGAKLASLEP